MTLEVRWDEPFERDTLWKGRRRLRRQSKPAPTCSDLSASKSWRCLKIVWRAFFPILVKERQIPCIVALMTPWPSCQRNRWISQVSLRHERFP